MIGAHFFPKAFLKDGKMELTIVELLPKFFLNYEKSIKKMLEGNKFGVLAMGGEWREGQDLNLKSLLSQGKVFIN